MANITVKPDLAELARTFNPNVYQAAYEKGVSLSAYLERMYPSEEYRLNENDTNDAFERLLRIKGIHTTSQPHLGTWADSWEDMHRDETTRALVPEFVSRIVRRTSTGMSPSTRDLYTSQDAALGTLENPYVDNATARWNTALTPAIPLNMLVAVTSPITSDAYRTYYLQSSTANQRQARVGEGADIPTFKITASENTIRLYKYGWGLLTTYEQLRRMKIDKVGMHIARMAVQTEVDKVVSALDILINGDGNANTAATVTTQSSLDSTATNGTLTLKAWLAFKMKFSNPYSMQVALVQEAVALQMLLLNTGSANVPLVMLQAQSGFGSFSPINPGLSDGVRLGWLSDAPALKIVGVDSRLALEHVVEVGSEMSEITRYARNQTQELVMTTVEGFGVIDQAATKILNINA